MLTKRKLQVDITDKLVHLSHFEYEGGNDTETKTVKRAYLIAFDLTF